MLQAQSSYLTREDVRARRRDAPTETEILGAVGMRRAIALAVIAVTANTAANVAPVGAAIGSVFTPY